MTAATLTNTAEATVVANQLIPRLKTMKPLFAKPNAVVGNTLTFTMDDNTVTVTRAHADFISCDTQLVHDLVAAGLTLKEAFRLSGCAKTVWRYRHHRRFDVVHVVECRGK